MLRNQIKIISNAQRHSLAFYYKTDAGGWRLVTNDSALSRKEYIGATVQSRAEDIIRVINSVYNPGNRGVDISFEGEEKDFLLLKNTIDSLFSQSNISCVMQKTSHVAVAGKIGAGKTTLIKGYFAHKEISCNYYEKDGNSVFADDQESIVWYEIPGIDFGAKNVTNARNAFEKLVKSGLTTFIYCLGTNKIETLEEELISFARNNYPEIKILVVLTKSVDDEQMLYIEQLSANLGGIKVIPTLAIDLKTRGGVVSAYGLDDIDRYIFEGK